LISVVTAYYNRKSLFIRTLDSFCSSIGKINFEVIAVDDGSDENERLEDLVDKYPFLKVIRLERENKWYSNSCIPFNIGFSYCIGDKVIIQNPECYHFGNILEHVDKNLKRNEYLSFGCFSLDKENTFDENKLKDKNNIIDLIGKNNRTHEFNGDLGWYNHSIFRPCAYHFCTAIMINDLMELGGFDERYALGNGFDDDEFIWRIQLKKMNVKIIDDKIVLHQHHYPNLVVKEMKNKNLENVFDRNKYIFNQITKCNHPYKVNVIETKCNQTQISLDDETYFYHEYNQLINRLIRKKYSKKIGVYLLKFILKF
jgi:hypothetical protein